MATASVALLLKGWAMPAQLDAADVNKKNEATTPTGSSLRPHKLAGGLLAILLGYLLLLPWLGYVVSVGLMSAAVALLSGGRDRKALLGLVLLTGPLLWFLFDFALKVRMPAGFWPKLFGG